MNIKETLKTLERFRNFAGIKGYDVNIDSDWGQKIEDKCPRTLRVVKIISIGKIEVLEEGKGMYDVNLNKMKEIDGTLHHHELFKKLYEDKCRIIMKK